MDKILIVDGSNLLFQMFYGMPARILGPGGQPIQGTLGFVGALLKIIRMTDPTHVAVLFDGECASGRTKLDGDYKANRPDYSEMEPEDTPFSQLPDIYAALDHLGISHRETSDCEVDDWIAGYAMTLGREQDMVICSFDSDFFQLITDRVKILRYRGEKTVLCDRHYLRDKLGIMPEKYAAFKALTGDAADNIPGIHKIGPKTAAALMNQFQDLEDLINHTDEIGKHTVRESVRQNIQRLRTNYLLIRLQSGAQLPFTKEELAWKDPQTKTTDVLKAIGLR